MLCCTLMSMAVQEDITISSLGNGDSNATVTTTDGVTSVTFPTAWTDMAQWWLGTKDCSAYEKLHLKFTSFSTESSEYKQVKVVIGYAGSDITTESYIAIGEDATGESDITLNSTLKSSVEKIYLQPSVASTFTVSEAYFYRDAPSFSYATIDVSDGIGKAEINSYANDVNVTITINHESGMSGWGTAAKLQPWNGSELETPVISYSDGTSTIATYTIGDLLSYMGDKEGLSINLQHSDVATLATNATLSVNAVTITIGAAGYATMMLPFAASIPDGMKVYTTELNNGKNAIVLTEANAIEANIPYIVGGTAKDYTFKGVSTATEYSYSGSVLTGTYESSLGIDKGDYILYNGGSGIGFYPAASGVTISQCHAYLPASVLGSSGESKLRFVFADDATGIAQTATEKATVVARYTLGGTRISAPQAGINIVKMSDGTVRKVIVK